MKIVFVGCSWTSGYGIDPNLAYPNIIKSLIPGSKVYNLASPGTSLTYSIHRTMSGIVNYNPDLVVFQGTTLDRATFGINGLENFTEERYLPHNEILLHLNQEVILNALEGNKKYFTKLSKDIGFNGSVDNLVGTVKFYGRNIMYDHHTLDNHMISLATLQSYLEKRKIKHLFFPYLHYTWEGRENFNIWKTKYANLVNEGNIIQKSFELWLKEKTDDNYYIDNGFHLNEDGHRLLAKEYLLPKLTQIINED